MKQAATATEIKQKYRKLSKKYHPDISKLDNAEEKFKEITIAYEILSSEEKRAEYNNKLKEESRGEQKYSQQKKSTKRAAKFSQGDFEQFEGRFKDYFGFDPETNEKIKEEDDKSEEIKTDDLFNSFFGVGKNN